jgi:hypothetical protein
MWERNRKSIVPPNASYGGEAMNQGSMPWFDANSYNQLKCKDCGKVVGRYDYARCPGCQEVKDKTIEIEQLPAKG